MILNLTVEKVNFSPLNTVLQIERLLLILGLLKKKKMLIERINLQHQLEALRKKEVNEEQILEQVWGFLRKDGQQREEIAERIASEGGENSGNNFDFELLEAGKIFHLSQIKKICIDYRLRFLNTGLYKEELPAEAISAVKELEKLHKTKLEGFKMIAPAKYFRLENADDPMLFAPIGNDYFYLIHKWGKDIHPLRKLLMWPLRNLETLIVFSFLSSFILSFGIRELFFSKYQETSQLLIIFMYTFKSVLALFFFYGISLGKNFSSGNWNSKFFNS